MKAMRFGYCLNANFLQGDEASQKLFNAVADAGFDYVELPLFSLSTMSANELSQLKKAAVPCRACNLFFPPYLSIVGPGMDIAGVRAYLEKMLPLVADLGVETLVFGNGGARKIPEDASHESIWANLRTLVEIMDEYAAKTGVIISVEPLNTMETNILNSYGEAATLTKGLQNVATMVDSYHAAMENQNFDDVFATPEKLKHLHTAYPVGRLVPSPEDDMSKYTEFVKMVKQVGYNDKISVEGGLRTKPLDNMYVEIAAALQVLKNLFYDSVVFG